VPDWLRRKVEAGELGHKTGKGIYEWKDGKPAKAGAKPAQNTKMTDRLILPMVNVCVACLREGIVEDQDVADGAMVTGFAPYRGGPLQYARSRGIENVILAQRELTKKFGERFAPDGSRDGRPAERRRRMSGRWRSRARRPTAAARLLPTRPRPAL
jgi:3-hydroxyacyl-CoA dehydrogenase / enoyl-CoA hydratase / 3-hydroxybutyryl-CoA epimerase